MNDAAVPTGPEGLSPFREERLIDTVVSATQLRVQTPFLETYMSPVRYAITDVLDVDEHLYQLLTALTMEQLGQMVGKPFAVNVVEAYRAALAADSAQSVSFQQRLGLAPRTIHARIETDYV
ncbi:MAG: hypothetical protein NZ821_05990 [Gloeomargarita sp. SKYB31]|nr:hypothetical protein [Gloeomargarita sp. SKYB31]